MPRTHNPYYATFRPQAVELAQTSGKPYRDVARDLGVSVDTLRAWRHQSSPSDTGPVATPGKPSELERENLRLRRELAYTQRQREILKKSLGHLLGATRPARRFELIEQMAMQTQEPIQLICQTLDVSRAGYYAHRHKPERPRRQQDQTLTPLIRQAFAASRKIYGSPRLQVALRRPGHPCGKNRVARRMRQAGLRTRQKRRFRPRTTHSNHGLASAENWLAKVPAPARPNQVWVSDITYLPTQEGWLFLAMTLDACSRKVVGRSTDDSLETFRVTEAQKLARQRQGPAPGLLHHSDRGVQYASSACQALLANFKITASMSRKGNCYDNALAESFFATLKTEAFEDGIPATKAQAKQQVFVYIETFYNPPRFHRALGYQSPVEFENQFC